MMDWYRLLPRYWLQNQPTCNEWDEILNRALDKFDVEPISSRSVKVGPLHILASNWPYAYGSAYVGLFAERLPKVATRKRLRSAILRAISREVEAYPVRAKAEQN